MPKKMSKEEYGFLLETGALIATIGAGAKAIGAIKDAIAPTTRTVRRAKDPAARKSTAGSANPNALVTFQGRQVTVNWIATQLGQTTATLERTEKKLIGIRNTLTASIRKNRKLVEKVDNLEDQRWQIGAGASILGLLLGFMAGSKNTENKLTSGKRR